MQQQDAININIKLGKQGMNGIYMRGYSSNPLSEARLNKMGNLSKPVEMDFSEAVLDMMGWTKYQETYGAVRELAAVKNELMHLPKDAGVTKIWESFKKVGNAALSLQEFLNVDDHEKIDVNVQQFVDNQPQAGWVRVTGLGNQNILRCVFDPADKENPLKFPASDDEFYSTVASLRVE